MTVERGRHWSCAGLLRVVRKDLAPDVRRTTERQSGRFYSNGHGACRLAEAAAAGGRIRG